MKISVITVCYNSAKTIEKTICSVLNQSFRNVEYIIIDGKSSDGTQKIIEQYEKDISYWISERDMGIYDAMNKGIRHSHGDVIAILNSDDWYATDDVLERVAEYFNNCSPDILVGKINCVINNRLFIDRNPFGDEEMIHTRMIYSHPAMFVKHSMYQKVGLYSLKYRIAADYEWTLRAHNMKLHIMQVPDIFVNFRMSGISTTEAYQCRLENREIALNNIGEHDTEILKKEICLYYDNVIEKNKYNYFFHKIWKDEIPYIRSLLDNSKKYYIWGTGYYGEECYELFMKIGVKVVGFIDNNIHERELHGYAVVTPTAIEDDCIICIATPKHEQEIVDQLNNMQHNSYIYFCFSDLQKLIYEYGKEKYGFD